MLKEVFRDGFKVLLLGSLAAGALFVAYSFWTRNPKKTYRRDLGNSVQGEQRLITNQSNYSEFYFDRTRELESIVRQIGNKQPTLEEIYMLSPLLVVDQYLKYTRQIRRRRRMIRKVSEKQYVSLIRSYEMEIDELLVRGRADVLEEYELGANDLYHMQCSFEAVENLCSLRKRAKQELVRLASRSNKVKKIPEDRLCQIVANEVAFIKEKQYETIKAQQQDEVFVNPEQTVKVIETYRDDLLYEKYGYEREQIQLQLDEAQFDQAQLKTWRHLLLKDIADFKMDSQESENSAQQGSEMNDKSLSRQRTLEGSLTEDIELKNDPGSQ